MSFFATIIRPAFQFRCQVYRRPRIYLIIETDSDMRRLYLDFHSG